MDRLHEPKNGNGNALLLTHGAGANADTPLLIAVAEAFCNAGVLVQRYDLPFRQKKPKGSPHPSGAAADRAGLKEAVQELRQRVKGKVWMGGHSYGGRQASMLAAEEPEVADGLLLLSYPLHPPGQPEKARTAHLPGLRTPAVFVHGVRDDFGTLDEMNAALATIPAKVELVPVQGAGHDLKKGKFDLEAMVLLAPKVWGTSGK
jgi:predicted alpha/beta-hydrolase family hydrolase